MGVVEVKAAIAASRPLHPGSVDHQCMITNLRVDEGMVRLRGVEGMTSTIGALLNCCFHASPRHSVIICLPLLHNRVRYHSYCIC